MSNGVFIFLTGVVYAFIYLPWWAGFVVGISVGFFSCVVVDLIEWVIKRATGK